MQDVNLKPKEGNKDNLAEINHHSFFLPSISTAKKLFKSKYAQKVVEQSMSLFDSFVGS